MTKENMHKGIVLAGGAGTRLHPLTKIISKQLLPIYDKPMIFYPLSTLIHSGVKEIMIITSPDSIDMFKKILGDGSQWDVKLEYAIQENPDGIAQSLIIAEKWLDNNPVILILGDNLFFGPNLHSKIRKAIQENDGATIFAYEVQDPTSFGVLNLDNENKIISIEEKPKNPKSNWIVTGMYIYNNKASSYSHELKKSDRGELEITDLNNRYLLERKLKAVFLDKNFSWLDTGTHDALLEASNFVFSVEKDDKDKVVNLKTI
ncbi:MAG: sugar phosphate nucleotidyltransferase [Pseudomonadota bacterium]|nr:sugar phosphate nucleotidyltransferase [Pseudomonadota bacterium]